MFSVINNQGNAWNIVAQSSTEDALLDASAQNDNVPAIQPTDNTAKKHAVATPSASSAGALTHTTDSTEPTHSHSKPNYADNNSPTARSITRAHYAG
jgi:hypothetical protein